MESVGAKGAKAAERKRQGPDLPLPQPCLGVRRIGTCKRCGPSACSTYRHAWRARLGGVLPWILIGTLSLLAYRVKGKSCPV